MVTEKDVRRAWVEWQLAENKEGERWSFEECLRLREKYYDARDNLSKQEGAL